MGTDGRLAPGIDDDMAAFGSFSSLPNHPSTSASFYAVETSTLATSGHRRYSSTSRTSSVTPELFSATSGSTACPSTPMSASVLDFSSIAVPVDGSGYNLDGGYGSFRSANEDGDFVWSPAGSKDDPAMSTLPYTSLDHVATQDLFSGSHVPGEAASRHGSTFGPLIPRPCWDGFPASSDFLSTEGNMTWSSEVLGCPPQTVAPSATFQQVLVSSPPNEVEPMTPTLQHIVPPASILSSSPSDWSPSRHHNLQYHPDGAERTLVNSLSLTPLEAPKVRRSHPRRGIKTASHFPRVTKSSLKHSGASCPEVIARNTHECRYDSCVDKKGKRKSFKRREHLKRHENTVHVQDKSRMHTCWVPLCTTSPFTRSDNLHSHLLKTHGKRTAGQRNRYDPEYKGEIDADGYPLR